MTERQNECINEIKELMLAINETVKKHGLEDEFIACLAVGFLDMENTHVDEYGDDRANMSLLSSFAVQDEEELEDLLSYCVEAHKMEQEEDASKIDYWINFGKRGGEEN